MIYPQLAGGPRPAREASVQLFTGCELAANQQLSGFYSGNLTISNSLSVQTSADVQCLMDIKPANAGASGGQVVTEPSDGTELRKPHEMIVMMPKSGRVTMTGRKVYNAMLRVAQSRLDAMGEVPRADFRFESPLAALLRTSGSSGDDRTAAKRYILEMGELKVNWESTAPGDGIKLKLIQMLVEPTIEVRNGENWVSWTYPPIIFEMLRDPKRWAKFSVFVQGNLGTYAAVALYEIVARYRDNPSGLTSRKLVSWWIDALSQAPAGSERREWRKFKNERLNPAIEEINAGTDLEIELIEHKQGRAVVEAQFSVRKKRATPQIKQQDQLADANLVLRAESLGIREMKLEGLIKEFGEQDVREKLEVLEKRTANRKLPIIDNSYSYLRSLLRNDTGAAEEPAARSSTQGSGDSAKQVGAVLQQIPVSQRGQPQGATQAALSIAAGQGQANDTWLRSRISEIKEEIRALSLDQQKVIAEQAVREMEARGSIQAVVARRFVQGDFLHGTLGVEVVRVYATAMYGADWDKPAPGADTTAAG